MTNSPNWEVEVRNFQSIKHAKIEVVPGLNVITGKTNSGKSAIFRAINASIFNSGTDDLVQAGQDIASVTISNGVHTMSYARNAKGKNEKTAYKFDTGKVIRKVGRTQLPEVAQMFGIKEIQMQNNVKMRLNFWYQNEKPFLMGNTSGQLFEFLSLSSADKYFKVLKSMKADLKVQEAEINNSNTIIDTLKMVNNQKEDLLTSNTGFDDVYTQIITAGAEADRVNKCLSIIENLERIKQQMVEIDNKLAQVNRVYNAIPISDVTQQYQELIISDTSYNKLFKSLVSLSQTKKQMGVTQGNLSTLTPKLTSYESAVSIFRGYLDSMSKIHSQISYLDVSIPKCLDVQRNIKQLTSKITKLSVDDIDISSLQNKLNNIVLLHNWCSKYSGGLAVLSSMKSNLDNLNSNISNVSNQIKAKSDELKDFKSSVGYCPFCGSVFAAGTVHSHKENN